MWYFNMDIFSFTIFCIKIHLWKLKTSKEFFFLSDKNWQEIGDMPWLLSNQIFLRNFVILWFKLSLLQINSPVGLVFIQESSCVMSEKCKYLFYFFNFLGPRLDFDPDIVAALDDDFDFDNPENILEDDFVLQANKPQKR